MKSEPRLGSLLYRWPACLLQAYIIHYIVLSHFLTARLSYQKITSGTGCKRGRSRAGPGGRLAGVSTVFTMTTPMNPFLYRLHVRHNLSCKSECRFNKLLGLLTFSGRGVMSWRRRVRPFVKRVFSETNKRINYCQNVATHHISLFFFSFSKFWIFNEHFFIFVNMHMGSHGSKNFKTLLLLQFWFVFDSTLSECSL